MSRAVVLGVPAKPDLDFTHGFLTSPRRVTMSFSAIKRLAIVRVHVTGAA